MDDNPERTSTRAPVTLSLNSEEVDALYILLDPPMGRLDREDEFIQSYLDSEYDEDVAYGESLLRMQEVMDDIYRKLVKAQ